jgi:hypothetical protein
VLTQRQHLDLTEFMRAAHSLPMNRGGLLTRCLADRPADAAVAARD